MTFAELIAYAKERGCSDVHITVGTAIALRRFGELEMLPDVPSAVESLELINEGLNSKQMELIQSGKDLDFALLMPNNVRMRANIYHQRNNLAASYRLLNDRIPTCEELQIPDAVRKLADEPRGLVLITGATGSGKTTTLASLIDYINTKKARHVITIEDPIEYVYPYGKSMIHQREVGRDVSDFATALRSALREDPDVILVGEMRDQETISAAITAAETGHLVFATLHTNSAVETVERIIGSYPPHAQEQARTQLANVLKGVCTQTLIPRRDGDGMVIATEVMLNNEAIANQIRESKTHQLNSSIQGAMMAGMHTMNHDIRRLEKSMVITREDALRFCTNRKEYEKQM